MYKQSMLLDEKDRTIGALTVSASGIFRSGIAIYLYISANTRPSPKNVVTIIWWHDALGV